MDTVENAMGCKLWVGGPDPKTCKYGRKKFSFPGEKSKPVYVHRLAYQLSRNILKLPSEGKFEVSHLCHNHRCVNPDHLVFESHEANCSRMTCKLQNLCTRGHAPPCIFLS